MPLLADAAKNIQISRASTDRTEAVLGLPSRFWPVANAGGSAPHMCELRNRITFSEARSPALDLSSPRDDRGSWLNSGATASHFFPFFFRDQPLIDNSLGDATVR